MHYRFISFITTASEILFCGHLGYVCEDHNNPSDFLLDIVSGAILPSSSEDEESPKRNGNGNYGIKNTGFSLTETPKFARCERDSAYCYYLLLTFQ